MGSRYTSSAMLEAFVDTDVSLLPAYDCSLTYVGVNKRH